MIRIDVYLDWQPSSPYSHIKLPRVPRVGEHLVLSGRRCRVTDVEYDPDGFDQTYVSLTVKDDG